MWQEVRACGLFLSPYQSHGTSLKALVSYYQREKWITRGGVKNILVLQTKRYIQPCFKAGSVSLMLFALHLVLQHLRLNR
jgi:hypothetical protein